MEPEVARIYRHTRTGKLSKVDSIRYDKDRPCIEMLRCDPFKASTNPYPISIEYFRSHYKPHDAGGDQDIKQMAQINSTDPTNAPVYRIYKDNTTGLKKVATFPLSNHTYLGKIVRPEAGQIWETNAGQKLIVECINDICTFHDRTWLPQTALYHPDKALDAGMSYCIDSEPQPFVKRGDILKDRFSGEEDVVVHVNDNGFATFKSGRSETVGKSNYAITGQQSLPINIGDTYRVKLDNQYVYYQVTRIDVDGTRITLTSVRERSNGQFVISADKLRSGFLHYMGSHRNHHKNQLWWNSVKNEYKQSDKNCFYEGSDYCVWDPDDYESPPNKEMDVKMPSQGYIGTTIRATVGTTVENKTKDIAMSNSTLVGMLKDDAVDFAYRSAAGNLNRTIRSAFVALLRTQGVKKRYCVTISEMLNTKAGEASLSFAIGLALRYFPGLKENIRAQRLAKEFRVGGMTTGGDALISKMMDGFVTNLVPLLVSSMNALPEPANFSALSDKKQDTSFADILQQVTTTK